MIVNDYTALLSGLSINGPGIVGRPTYVTFSFAPAPPEYLKVEYPASFLVSYTPFAETDRLAARAAMQQWADASGLIAVEVDGVGDINFARADTITLLGATGFALYPEINRPGISSDIFIALAITDAKHLAYLLLHEIGHALGLKHPFEGEPKLAPDLDNNSNTLMSYTTPAGAATDRLAPFDLQAVAALYGPQSADGTNLAGITFDPASRSSVQIGTSGADVLRGVGGWTNRIEGGAGDDQLSSSVGTGIILGGDGSDHLFGVGTATLDGGAGDDLFDIMPGGVTVLGGSGDDFALVVVSVNPLSGPLIHYDGGDGFDQVDFRGAYFSDDLPLIFSLADALAAGSTIANVEVVTLSLAYRIRNFTTGSDGVEYIGGGLFDDVLSGLGGNDQISGSEGNDQLRGGDGADVVLGEEGDDRIEGGEGDDLLIGGAGADLFQDTTAGLAGDTITDFAPGDRIRIIDAAVQGFAVSLAGGTLTYTGGSLTLADLPEGYRVVASALAAGGIELSLVAGEQGFRLFAPAGFVGEIGEEGSGGQGAVFGTSGFQDLSLLDSNGDITFDPSFNRGGDVIRLPGAAADYTIARLGSSALLADGDRSITIPMGEAGTSVVFEDGARILVFDPISSSMKIGGQTFSSSPVQITAPGDGGLPPGGSDPEAEARLFLTSGEAVAVAGNYQIFGSASFEQVTWRHGDVRLDPSFNRGGDVLHLPGEAHDYTAARLGSSVVLESDEGRITIPIGTIGTVLDFAREERVLLFAVGSGNVIIDEQIITDTATALIA